MSAHDPLNLFVPVAGLPEEQVARLVPVAFGCIDFLLRDQTGGSLGWGR